MTDDVGRDDDRTISEGSSVPRTVLGWAAAAGAAVLALYVAVMADYFRVFQPFSDDAGVVLNSCSPYFAAGRWTEWFTRGWAAYAVNYPDWGPFGNNTMKPVVNLVFLLEGKLTPLLGNAAFLIGSYVAPAVTAAALVVAFHRLARTSPAVSFVLSLCVATSAFWIGSLVNAVDMTNTLALMFSSIVIALLPVGERRPSPALLAGLAVLQLLAIFSHETALVLPPVCVVLLFALSDERPRLPQLWPYLLAPAVWVAVRLFILQSRSGVYALTGSGLLRAKVWGYWLISALVPVDTTSLAMARGLAPMRFPAARGILLASVGVVVAVNIAFVVVFAVALLQRRTRTALLLGLAFVIATVPHLTTAFDPYGARFAGLSMVVGILGIAVLANDRRAALAVAASVLLAAQVLFSFTGLVERKLEAAALSHGARDYTAYVHDAVGRARPERVVVVNDRYGQYGVPALVRLAAWPQKDFDVVVIDNLYLGHTPGGSLSIRRQGDDVEIDSTVDGDSAMSFLGADKVDFAVPNRGFTYTLRAGSETAPTSFSAIGPLSGRRTLVLGHDTHDGSTIRPQLFE